MNHVNPDRLASVFVVDRHLNVLEFADSPDELIDVSTAGEHIGVHLSNEKHVAAIESAMGDAVLGKEQQAVPLVMSNGLERCAVVKYLGEERWIISFFHVKESGDLSPRQQYIIQALARDETIQSIAASLAITQSAVQSHLQAARKRFGFETTAGLVAYCVEKRLVSVNGGHTSHD